MKGSIIASNTLTRMKYDKKVTIQVLERVCAVLNEDFGDIIEYIPDEGMEDIYSLKMHNNEPVLQE